MIFKLIDENTEETYSFKISDLNVETFDDEVLSSLSEFVDEKGIEVEYGTLDVVSDDKFYGYSSYELEPEQFEELIKMFEEWFEAKGYEVD
jgi:uridine phosphorylase